MPNQSYIQVGVTALRDPITGDFLPSVPLYVKAEDGREVEVAEKAFIGDIAGVFAKKMKEYVEAHGGLGHIESPIMDSDNLVRQEEGNT